MRRLLIVILAGFCQFIAAQNAALPNSKPDLSDARATKGPAASPEYRVGESDILQVSVWKEPDLSKTVNVRPDGMISLPLIGELKVMGMTSGEIQDAVASKLKSYLLNPRVTVEITEIKSRRVFITGEVIRPGLYPLAGPTTVLQLIAQAGGFTPFAKRKNIVILRPENGVQHKYPFNYSSVVMAGTRNRTFRSRPEIRWWSRELLSPQTPSSSRNWHAVSASGSECGQSGAAASDSSATRTYVPSLFGQQPIAVDAWQPSAPSSESAPAVGVVDNAGQGAGAVEPWAPYMRNVAQHYVLYGLNLSANYTIESGTGSAADYSLFLPQIMPYVGFMGRTRTGFYVLQYSPSVVPWDSQDSRSVTFHNFTFDSAGAFTRRLTWTVNVREGYGGEIGRLTSNLNSQAVVAGVSESNSNYATVQPLTGNSLSSSATAGLGYQFSPRTSAHLAASDNYYAFMYQPAGSVPNVRSHAIGMGGDIDETLSHNLTVRLYGSGDRVYSNYVTCDTISGGLALAYQPTRLINVDVGGGPSKGCGAQAANFHATVGATLRNQFKVYAGVARQMNTIYRLNSFWEDDVTGGVGKQFGHADLGFDAGYFHGQPLGLTGPANGYFVSPRINYSLRLSRISGISFSYRRFHGSSGTGGPPDVSFAMITLSFSPAPLALEK